jgi:hypothetical protein
MSLQIIFDPVTGIPSVDGVGSLYLLFDALFEYYQRGNVKNVTTVYDFLESRNRFLKVLDLLIKLKEQLNDSKSKETLNPRRVVNQLNLLLKVAIECKFLSGDFQEDTRFCVKKAHHCSGHRVDKYVHFDSELVEKLLIVINALGMFFKHIKS